MSEEFSAHAFDMFTQEKVTSRSTYQGTGLGLAIVKQLVDRMGGSVTLRHVAQQPRKVFEAAGVGRMMTID